MRNSWSYMLTHKNINEIQFSAKFSSVRSMIRRHGIESNMQLLKFLKEHLHNVKKL